MSKNFINFLTTSVIIPSCGAAINSSSCYCMESKYSNINTEQNSNSNITNTNTEQIEYNKDEFIEITKEIFTNWRFFNIEENTLRHSMQKYLTYIDKFYNGHDIDTLPQLTSIVFNAITDNTFQNTCLVYNIDELLSKNIINTDEYKKLLYFDLFLITMINIETTDSSLLPEGYKSEINEVSKINDGQVYYNNSGIWWPNYFATYNSYSELLGTEHTNITNRLIKQSFVLNNPETWIPKEELVEKMNNEIKNIFDSFDYLPLIKTIFHNKHITSIYDYIPVYKIDDKVFSSNAVGLLIEAYFNIMYVRNILVQELIKYFREIKVNRLYHIIFNKPDTKFGNNVGNKPGNDISNKPPKNIGKIHSQYIWKDILKYLSTKRIRYLARYIRFPESLFNDKDKIPYIVLSYIKDNLVSSWSDMLQRYNLEINIPYEILLYMEQEKVIPWNDQHWREEYEKYYKFLHIINE